MKRLGREAKQYGLLKTKGGTITKFAYLDTVEYCGMVNGINKGILRLLMRIGDETGEIFQR
ncbi:MAG: hypothetical protein SWO11_16900 [Thermodesulfobacteriota bacterium]|nr:hypothetical protein [Thermodesulfobacteriota bacterium]